MRIPTRGEFAPLPEVIDRFGLPDPLEVLPLLENQLEAVPVSSAHIREIAAGLRGAANDLESEANAVTWFGEAADLFRSKIAHVAQSFRQAADNIDAAVAAIDEISEKTKDRIREILQTIAVVAGGP